MGGGGVEARVIQREGVCWCGGGGGGGAQGKVVG